MDVVMPQLGETVTEGTVTKWYKKVGDAIRADEALFDVETDKVSTEIPAPASGTLAEILVAAGATAKVGARLAVIRDAGSAVAAPAATAAGSTQAAVAAPTGSTVAKPPRPDAAGHLSPVVRRLIAEHGLDATRITGSGASLRLQVPRRYARRLIPYPAPLAETRA